MTLWADVKSLEERVRRIASAVDVAVRPKASKSRELMTVMQQEVQCDEYIMTTSQGTFINGDQDTIELWRLAATVSVNHTPATAGQLGRREPMMPVPNGWTFAAPEYAVANSEGYLRPEFEFRWSYTVGSRAAQYTRNLFADSRLLVGLDRGRALDFRAPLIIPRGESIEFYVEPTAYGIPLSSGSVTTSARRYYVNFIGLGLRRSA